MIQGIRIVLFFSLAGAVLASAQDAQRSQILIMTPGVSGDPIDNPVAQVRSNKSWEFGPFVNGGNGLGNRDQYYFFRAGFQLGKIISRPLHPWPFPGQFEFGGNIMPLWQAYTPAQHPGTIPCEVDGQLQTCDVEFGGGTFRGVSLTPVIFRWNFLTKSKHFQPWFQAAGGLIYTTHKFPPNFFSYPALGIDGGTSVWNFSPQGGMGIHYFTRAGRSWDLGVNGVHISSASLGDRNPGVNASVEVQLGYTFWR